MSGPSLGSLANLANLNIQPPDPLARVGAGMNDVIAALRSLYLHSTNPAAAAAYDAQQRENDAIYARGVGGPGLDPLRMIGQTSFAAPLVAMSPELLAATPEAAMGQMGTMQLFSALNRLRQIVTGTTPTLPTMPGGTAP